MFMQDDRENVYGLSSIPYQPAYKDKETLLAAQRQQKQPSTSAQPERHTSPMRPMPKGRAMTLARKLKRWVVVSSLVSMGAFGGLIMTHLSVSGTTSQNQTTKTSSTSTTSKTSSSSTTAQTQATATPTASTTSDPSTSGGFLQQQGGDQFGSTSSSQQPVTGSHAS